MEREVDHFPGEIPGQHDQNKLKIIYQGLKRFPDFVKENTVYITASVTVLSAVALLTMELAISRRSGQDKIDPEEAVGRVTQDDLEIAGQILRQQPKPKIQRVAKSVASKFRH